MIGRRAGFHRPLAGFFTLAMPYLLLFVFLIIYRFDTLPRTLVPWGQTLHFWETTARWFDVAWLLFDFGTGVAAVYYFAKLRSRHLRESFRYFRFYVWWQVLSGVLQLVIVIHICDRHFARTRTWRISHSTSSPTR